MKGRVEHEMKVNDKIADLIKDYPDYLEDFNISMEAEGKTHNTRLVYIRAIINYLNYLKDCGNNIFDTTIFEDITTTQIKKYLASIRYKDGEEGREEKSGSYINTNHMALSSFFGFLRESRIISENPLLVDGRPIKIKKKKEEEREPVVLNHDEIRTVYSNIDSGVGSKLAQKRQEKWKERDLAIIDLALNTGLRVSALTEINVEDIDFKNLTISVVEKGNKAVTIDIDGKCAETLKKWLKKRKNILEDDGNKTNALFISNRKERITQNSIANLVKKYAIGVDKNVHAHTLRKTFGTSAMIATGDLHAVQTSLGHAAGGVTERYLGNKKEERRTVANAVRNYYAE